MKEDLIKPYCCCGESESSLVDNAIFVYSGDKYRRVLLDEILRVEASGSYYVIYMEDGVEITVNYPLDRTFSSDLPCNKFKRIHRLYAINLFKVTGFAGDHVHTGKEMLPVSESHKKDFQACPHRIYLKRALEKRRKGVGGNSAPSKIKNLLRKERALSLHRKLTREKKQLSNKFKNDYYGS